MSTLLTSLDTRRESLASVPETSSQSDGEVLSLKKSPVFSVFDSKDKPRFLPHERVTSFFAERFYLRKHPKIYLNLALHCYTEKQFRNASIIVEKGLEIIGANARYDEIKAELLILKTVLLFLEDDYRKAYTIAAEVKKIPSLSNDVYARAFCLLSITAQRLGEFKRAIIETKNGLSLDAMSAELRAKLWMELASVQNNIGRPTRAQHAAQQGLRIAIELPGNIKANLLIELSEALYHQERYDEAQEAAERGLEITSGVFNNTKAILYVQLSAALIQKKLYDEAKKVVIRGLRIKEDVLDYTRTRLFVELANAYNHLGFYEMAHNAVEQGLKLNAREDDLILFDLFVEKIMSLKGMGLSYQDEAQKIISRITSKKIATLFFRFCSSK